MNTNRDEEECANDNNETKSLLQRIVSYWPDIAVLSLFLQLFLRSPFKPNKKHSVIVRLL